MSMPQVELQIPAPKAVETAEIKQPLQYHEVDESLSEWELARLDHGADWRDSCRLVEHVMTSDLFTVHPEDIVDLAASVMDWEHVRHVPVEDRAGRLVGIVSHRQLLRLVGRGQRGGNRSHDGDVSAHTA